MLGVVDSTPPSARADTTGLQRVQAFVKGYTGGLPAC